MGWMAIFSRSLPDSFLIPSLSHSIFGRSLPYPFGIAFDHSQTPSLSHSSFSLSLPYPCGIALDPSHVPSLLHSIFPRSLPDPLPTLPLSLPYRILSLADPFPTPSASRSILPNPLHYRILAFPYPFLIPSASRSIVPVWLRTRYQNRLQAGPTWPHATPNSACNEFNLFVVPNIIDVAHPCY